MKQKEIEEFKEEMKYYSWLKDTVALYKEKCDSILYEMAGVKAINYDKLPSSINPSSIERHKLSLIPKYNQAYSKWLEVQTRLDKLNDVLYRMDLYERNMFLFKYELGMSYQEVANKYYISKAGLFYRMNKALEKL